MNKTKIISIKEDINLINLYNEYLNNVLKNHSESYIFSFDEIINNVYAGLREYTNEEDITENYLLTNLYSVLEAMVYNAKNSLEKMIERAESDYSQRYEKMNNEQKQICNLYRLNFKNI